MMLKALAFLVLIVTNCSGIHAQANHGIKAVFRKFQEGYTKRDTTQASAFAQDLVANDIQIIGTGEEEWMTGIDAARNLFKNDWAYWMALSIDTTNISITTSGNAAFFMTRGIASITFPSKEAAYDFAMGRLQQLVNGEKTNRGKLLSYSSQASDLIHQIEMGSLEIKYSIRLSGGLMKQGGKWYFKQLVFSFPYPMTRK